MAASVDAQHVEKWTSFFQNDGNWRLWCRQHVGYEGLYQDRCSYLIFAKDLQGVAAALTQDPKVVGECIPFPDFAGEEYRSFVRRHPEMLCDSDSGSDREDEDFRDFSLPGQQSRFMEAIREESYKNVLDVLCTHLSDRDSEGNFCTLQELSPQDFPDVSPKSPLSKLANLRRKLFVKVLTGPGSRFGKSVAEMIVSFLYPPQAAAVVLQEERLTLWQACSSFSFGKARSIFVLGRSHGHALRRLCDDDSLRALCEPENEMPGWLSSFKSHMGDGLATLSDGELAAMLGVLYRKGHFRSLTVAAAVSQRVLSLRPTQDPVTLLKRGLRKLQFRSLEASADHKVTWEEFLDWYMYELQLAEARSQQQ
ncbi:unnamed protein product [Symbiodinium natans]|uniref:Uncharacterized protein n=1 Tax=Symbiodinium natans TaxID=878477 RepID=A0A812HY73_9DINO|nr:unnamed protein product [Symbiodinium natans]